jgi:hypothetical protein
MLSDHNVRDAFWSRYEESASGNDGISEGIMKTGGLQAVKFMRYIITATIRCARMMDSWKETQTVFIWTIGDRENLKNWRPIISTNYLYRIYMCLTGRAFQQMDLRQWIYVVAQKGFLRKVTGCSEHDMLLNRLFQDAKKKNKDLVVIAIDFLTALSCVPHHLIVSTLEQLNFPGWVRAITRDMYAHAKSTVEYKGRQTGSIKWRKEIKQGCPSICCSTFA